MRCTEISMISHLEGNIIDDAGIDLRVTLCLWSLLSFHPIEPLGRWEGKSKFDLHYRPLVSKAPNAKSPKAMKGLEAKTIPAPNPPTNRI